MDRTNQPLAPASPDRSDSIGSYARRVLVFVALVTLAVVLWQISTVLMLAFGGIVLAVVFRAFGTPLARLTGLSDSTGTAIAIVVLFGAIAAGVWLFGQHASAQLTDLWQNFVLAYAQARQWIGDTSYGGAIVDRIQSGVQQIYQFVASSAFALLGGIAEAILVIAAAVYLALNPGIYRRGFAALVPPSHRGRVDHAFDAAGQDLRRWMLGQGISMFGVAVATSVGLWLIGVPMAFTLGVVAGLLDFIPFVGPFLAAVPGVLIAFQESPQTALYALLVYFVVQQIEGNLLQPLAQRWAVHLPPALGLFSVVAFGVLFGVVGILFAVPLTVVTMVLVRELYVKRLESNAPPEQRQLRESAVPRHR